VARNQPRKGLPILIEAFARFAERHRAVMLHLHTNPWDPEGWMLKELLRRHGIENRTSFTGAMLNFERVADSQMRDIYRSFDLFVLPTMSEGFGLPILEAMACGIPVVATEGSAVSELLEGRGELIPVRTSVTVPPHCFEVSLADPEALLETLERLYTAPRLREDYGRRGRAFAEKMTWDASAQNWRTLLEKVLARQTDSVTTQGAVEIPHASKVTERPSETAGKSRKAVAIPAVAAALGTASVEQGKKIFPPRAFFSRPQTPEPLWQEWPIRIERYADVVQAGDADLSPRLPRARRREVPRVVWKSPVFEASGYGDEARAFLLPLTRRLQHLQIDATDWLPQRVPVDRAEQRCLAPHLDTSVAPPYVEVVQHMPSYFKRNELASYRVGRTMFEFLHLPPLWVEECNAMDELWLPSTFCQDLFAESGVATEKLRLVPGGIDTRRFRPEGTPSEWRVSRDRRSLRFLAVFMFLKRKGWDRLVEAYAREFTRHDPVELVLRTFHPGQTVQEIAVQLMGFLATLGIPLEHLPPIILLDEQPLSQEQMRNLYRSADALVAPSRGEGYGRPLLEALACGVPVITTRWGGQTDFVTEGNGWLLDYRLTLADTSDNALFRGMLCADPDVEHLQCSLREAFENGELRQQKGTSAPSSVALYDREIVAETVADRLQVIGTSSEVNARREPSSSVFRIPSPYLGPGSTSHPWLMLTSPHQRCGIRESTSQLLDGGLQESFNLLSCPELFRNFHLDTGLVHLQYHPAYVNPHQFAHHPPAGKLVASVHEVLRFDEIAHLFDAIIVHNERDRRHLLQMRLKPECDLQVIPLGCNAPACPTYEPPVRKDPVVAYHGFLSPHKGMIELIDAFSAFRGRHPQARLLFAATVNAYNEASGQAYLDDCRRRAGELGLSESVEFITDFLSVAEVIDLLHRCADLVVLPYLHTGNSGSSGAARVALASGKPVIVSDAPIFGDLQEEVIKFDAEKMATLPDLLSVVWRSENLQRRTVGAGLKKVRTEGWDAVARQHLALYRRLIANRTGAGSCNGSA
jgi:glycosyltransferase involved in cell wall biosynthesis